MIEAGFVGDGSSLTVGVAGLPASLLPQATASSTVVKTPKRMSIVLDSSDTYPSFEAILALLGGSPAGELFGSGAAGILRRSSIRRVSVIEVFVAGVRGSSNGGSE